MAINTHFQRNSRRAIEEALLDTPVVFVMGARQSGKTTLVRELATADSEFINLDDQSQLQLIQQDPIGFIKLFADKRIVVDEVQRLPELLLAIKMSVDDNRKPGRFLITGSANALLLPQVADSLAGRIEAVLLSPLSECEIRGVEPSFLQKLITGQNFSIKEGVDKEYICQRVVTGCFPEPISRESQRRTQAWYKQYVNFLIKKDMAELSHIDQPEKLLQLLKVSAHYSAKLVNFSEIAGKIGLTAESVRKYLALIEQLFLMKRIPAWHCNVYKRLIKTPKLHLSDTGLVCAIQDIDTDWLMKKPDYLGSLLETFVINELLKQASWMDKNLVFSHYRDKDKYEVDCIIEDANRSCFAIEVKASATLNNSDFRGLKRFKNISGERFSRGVLLYCGDKVLPFGEGLLAIPISALWAE